MDVSPGSAALAIAAAGAMEYEGVAANEVHRDWLDATMDRCVMDLAGKDKTLANKLGAMTSAWRRLGSISQGP